jgi:transcriptional/translational regulatory protein YebC/TACO1
METDNKLYTVYTDPDSFQPVAAALESAGYKFLSAQLEMVPKSYIRLTDEDDVRKMQKLLECSTTTTTCRTSGTTGKNNKSF